MNISPQLLTESVNIYKTLHHTVHLDDHELFELFNFNISVYLTFKPKLANQLSIRKEFLVSNFQL